MLRSWIADSGFEPGDVLLLGDYRLTLLDESAQEHHAEGFEGRRDAVGDLRRQPLLYLEAPGKGVHHPGKLTDPHHPVPGQIAHVGLTVNGRKVMLAVGNKGNIAQQQDLVVTADLLEGALQIEGGILGIAGAIFAPRPRDAFGGVEQPLTHRIVACPADQRAHGVFGLFAAGPCIIHLK